MTLAEYIIEHDTTQAAVARRLGVSSAAICQMISGRKRPSLALAIRMQLELGVDVTTWA